ncbi:heparinase II/III family protein [Puniceicoccaceae bacterium K14]|nr:heparinase II/III family protein [Puniceicoccaceae bacterium K14]
MTQVASDLLSQVNGIVETPFESLDACFDFYRDVLPKRVGAYHQEEVGPTYHHDLPGEADKFVNKIFHLGEGTMDMSDGLNWYGTATGDLEWNGGLVRQGYFMLLAEEYRKTGDEKYAATIVEHILHYIENVPPFEPEGKPYLEYKKSTWRPFEAAGRAAETWPEALAKIINSKSMNAEAWAKILISVHEHAVFLRKEHWQTGNHATLEVAAVGIIAVFYQEFKEREAWLKYAVEFLDGMWTELFNDDGYSKEMSGSYHWVAMRSFFTFYEVALNNGYVDIFPENYRDRLILNSYAEFYQDKPNFSTPISNDSSTRILRREQLERMHNLFDLPDINYFLTDGKEGTKPEITSYLYPNSRVAIMRDEWSSDANYMFFDMGDWGDNHMNQDQLNLEVYAKGRHFLVNGGKWRYTTSDPDADWMPLAKYFKNTSSYNCVLVNGYEQIFGDARGTMISGESFDYADGTFDAGFGEVVPGRDEKLFRERGLSTLMEDRMPGVSHRRQILFVKPDFWIVRDTIAGPNVERAEQLWHFYDGAIAPVGGAESAWSTQFEDSNLIVKTIGSGEMSANSYEGQKEPFIAGWHCPYYDVVRPAPELRFEQKAKDEIVFHTLIAPVNGAVTEAPEFSIEGSTYKVSFNGKNFSIETAVEGAWTIA